MTVVTPDQVETQIEAIDFWWRENRPAAPRLFVEELAACFDLLGCLPQVGRPSMPTMRSEDSGGCC